MSFWTSATVAAKSAVIAPTHATTVLAWADTSKNTCARTTRNTPAVTIVAAWMSAETGVGPSIASGSHECSGTCADFAAQPTKSIAQARYRRLGENLCAATPANASAYEIEPTTATMMKM